MRTLFSHLVRWLAVTVVMCAGASQGSHADSYAPEYLFTLQYGEHDDQVGVYIPRLAGDKEGIPAGPTALAIGPDGSIYIADRINHCVKRFDEYGELLMRTEGRLDNIQFLAVDSTGDVLALGGAGMGTFWKFGADGQQLWRATLGAAMPAEVRGQFSGWLHQMAIGPDDTLCVKISGSPSGVAVFDPEGSFLRAYEGYACTPSGKIVSVGAVPYEKLAAEVHVSDLEGRPLASYVANSRAGDPGIFDGAVHGFSRSLFDSRDYMYTIVHGTSAFPIVLSEDLTIRTDVIVTRHEPSGRAVAYLRFPGFPFYTGRDMTVDAGGNVYQLSYNATSVDVVRYRVDASSEEVESLRVLAAISRGGSNYVPLRVIAKHAGMSLEWDAATKRAILSSGARRHARAGEGTARASFGAGEPGVALHYGRLWVSVEMAAARLDITVYTDPTKRIAYVTGPASRRVALLAEAGD